MSKKRTNGIERTLKLIAGLIVIAAVLFVLNILFAAPVDNSGTVSDVIGSTYSESAGGESLLYALLGKLGFQVSQHRYPLEAQYFEKNPADIIWHVNSPAMEPGEDEVAWVNAWVSNGGTLVLINNPELPSVASLEPDEEVSEDALLRHWMKEVQLTSIFSRVQHISTMDESATSRRVPVRGNKMPTSFGTIGLVNTYEKRSLVGPLVFRFERNETAGDFSPIIRDGHGVVMTMISSGKGFVWLISDPYLFSNLLLQEADNAALATSLAMSSSGGETARIAFDEYHLGFYKTVTIIDAARTPLGKAILFLGAIAALALGTAGARFGRARVGEVPSGVSQRAFVGALAGLWLAADASTAAADALWRRYHSRSSVKRRGLDEELDKMRKGSVKTDELLETAKKLD
jgi:hypothetical protein